MSKIDKHYAIELMRGGRHLVKMHAPHGVQWYIVPGGPVSDDVAQWLLARADIQPSADGLFPGISQTFKYRTTKLRLVTDAMRADAYRQNSGSSRERKAHANDR
jgi:hypothetical protein